MATYLDDGPDETATRPRDDELEISGSVRVLFHKNRSVLHTRQPQYSCWMAEDPGYSRAKSRK
jgi:hypothetical protein